VNRIRIGLPIGCEEELLECHRRGPRVEQNDSGFPVAVGEDSREDLALDDGRCGGSGGPSVG
jgi:hypothetical protein